MEKYEIPKEYIELKGELEKSYKILNELYRDILNNFNKLVFALDFNHPFEITETFNYARKLGVLSQGHNFYLDDDLDQSLLEYKKIPYSSIIIGKGCCRNIAPFLKNIFDTFNISSKLLSLQGFYDLDTLTLEQRIQYEKAIRDFVMYQNQVFHKVANHVINVINYNKNIIFIDASNECIVVPENGKFISIHKTGENEPKFIQEITMIRNIIDRYNNMFDVFKYKLSKTVVSDKEYLEIQGKIIEKCKQNDYMFEELYRQNEPKYEEFKDELNKVRKLIKST